MTIRDGDWTLIDYDFASGRSVWSIFDGEKTIIRTDYPVAQAIEQNTLFRNAAPSDWKGDWHRIASVPLNLAHEGGLVEAANQHDDKFISRFLNDSDNRAWRTKEGIV
ncbi:hypothetical protein [Brucella pituitosa]|uniref:Uncharacterized protein n=1 Tax=Brucella pituitosa TaxID=571256 RepID=A0A643F681_9HYPH|nr:hypothetical protein [Brucella pituitosa]KAB0573384.1 hypothetical protein F7Q93_02515 [Brucella pituitosa]